MDTSANLGLFSLSVALISLSGVMMPGPITAVAITKGYKDPNAGIWVALGHGIIEIPLIVAIYLGFGRYVASPGVKMAIGLVGGLTLIYMGVQMFRGLRKESEEAGSLPYNSLVAGIITTAANPYFFLWWATVGVALAIKAEAFGLIGLAVFASVHWLCDLAWDSVVSRIVFRFKRLWSQKTRKIILILCALVFVGFGAWFIFSAFQ